MGMIKTEDYDHKCSVTKTTSKPNNGTNSPHNGEIYCDSEFILIFSISVIYTHLRPDHNMFLFRYVICN